jgi:hypothetical protein
MEEKIGLFRKWFKRNKKESIKKGDVGVYHDELCLYMLNDNNNNTVRHKIYAKVTVLGVYTNLVEIDILGSINIPDSTSDELTNLISKNFPKYVDPKNVRWEIKEND